VFDVRIKGAIGNSGNGNWKQKMEMENGT